MAAPSGVSRSSEGRDAFKATCLRFGKVRRMVGSHKIRRMKLESGYHGFNYLETVLLARKLHENVTSAEIFVLPGDDRAICKICVKCVRDMSGIIY